MDLKIDSTTDSDTDVLAAIGNQKRLAEKPSEVKVTEEKPEKEEVVASGTTEEEKPEVKEDEEKKGKGLDKRFAKLTRQRKEAEARAQDSDKRASYWENEAKKYRELSEPKKTEAKPEEKVQVSNGEPKEEDFEKHSDYIKAWTKWDRINAAEEAKIEARKAETRASIDNLWKEYSKKEEAFKKEKSDFQERVDAVKEAGIRMSPAVEDRIIRSGGPELAYELMKDVDEFKALCEMTAEDAIEHIGIIKAQMKSSEKPQEKKEVVEIKQPKPVSPVGSKVTVIKDPEKMSIKEYDAWRRAGNSPT